MGGKPPLFMFKNSKGQDMSDDFSKMQQQLQEFRSKELPEQLEYMLMLNTDKAFDDERYPGKAPWKQRSDKWLKQKADKKDNKFDSRSDRRGLLTGSGALRSSIETDSSNGEVSIGTDKPYGQIHNEGMKGMAFGKYPFDMPQRQFMPVPGEELPFQKDVDDYIDGMMDKILG